MSQNYDIKYEERNCPTGLTKFGLVPNYFAVVFSHMAAHTVKAHVKITHYYTHYTQKSD